METDDPKDGETGGNRKAMKRILTMVICLVMMFAAVSAIADDDIPLATKLQRQMQHDGNGVKGQLTITADADASEYPFINAFQNAEFRILRNAYGDLWHLVIYQAEMDETGKKEIRQFNKSEIYRGEQSLFFRSDFLPNEVFQLPEEISMILPEGMTKGENPSLNPVFLSLLNMNEVTSQKQDAAIEKYSKMLEKWIDGFQEIPEQIRNEDGSMLMKMSCIVPAEEVCREIAEIVTTAAADPEMDGYFSQIMTDEQKAVYLNPDLGYYYMEALAGSAITGDVRYTRMKTALGQTVSKELILPINPDITGYEILKIKNSGERSNWILQGEKGIIQLNLPENIEKILEGAEYQFSASYLRVSNDRNSEEANLAIRMEIKKTSEIRYDSEDEMNHEISTYSAVLRRDTSSLPEGVEDTDIDPYEDLSAELVLHYSGKKGPNASTRLEIGLKLKQGDLDLKADGHIKTAKAWPFVPFNTENALELEKLTEAEKAAAGIRLLKNADEVIERIAPVSADD